MLLVEAGRLSCTSVSGSGYTFLRLADVVSSMAATSALWLLRCVAIVYRE
jgi:hypothetical protein